MDEAPTAERALIIRSNATGVGHDGIHVLAIDQDDLSSILSKYEIEDETFSSYKVSKIECMREIEREQLSYKASLDIAARLQTMFDGRVPEETRLEMEEYLQVLREENRDCRENARRSLPRTGLIDESHAIIQFLRKENLKVRNHNREIVKQLKAAKEAFDKLTRFAKRQNVEVAQLKKLYQRASEDLKATKCPDVENESESELEGILQSWLLVDPMSKSNEL